jgi:transcription elongation factor S-II
VGKLRTHEDKKVADLAKETVKKWKNDVGGHKKPDTGTSSASSTTATASGKAVSPVVSTKISSDPASTSTTLANGSVKADSGSSNVAPSEKKDRNAKKDGIPVVITQDKARDGSIHLLYNAIVLDSDDCTLNHILFL